jgi:hypothetical protein
MQFFLMLTLTVALTAFAQINESSDEVRAAYRLYGFHNCNQDQESAILEALKDKHQITGAPGVQNINWHSAAVIDFLG